MSTWAEIKLKSLQKMFAASNTILNDSATKEYVAAMPGACNEALQMLATAGKFIIKAIDIAHNPVDNLLSDGDRIKKQERGTMRFEVDGARSMYFEYYGVGTYKVYVNNVQKLSGTLASRSGYSVMKKLIENPNDAKVVLEIYSSYPIALKNVALYSATFETENDIQSYAEYVRYPLKTLATDFYMLDDSPLVFEGDVTTSRYINTSDFFQEGNTVLVLPRNLAGNFKVFYKAYPTQITSSTADDYVLELDPEVEALLPLYIASQLYKDDDIGIATTYRNEFEIAFERLKDSVIAPSAEHFTSETGWI